MRSNTIMLIAACILLVACQKEIKIDLNETQPKAVITANYIANDSVVLVQVSMTSSYFDGYADNFVNNATVTISENGGPETIIPFTENGNYKLFNYAPTFGANYTLKVIHDGVDYQATQFLNAPISLLPSTSEYVEASIFSPEGYVVKYSFQDPSTMGNAYKIVYTYGGKRYDKFSELNISKDDFTNGNIMQGQPLDVFEIGDTVITELQTINMSMYNYYNQLQVNTSSFTAANGNPNFMWTNKALGYFSAYSYDTDTIIVQP